MSTDVSAYGWMTMGNGNAPRPLFDNDPMFGKTSYMHPGCVTRSVKALRCHTANVRPHLTLRCVVRSSAVVPLATALNGYLT